MQPAHLPRFGILLAVGSVLLGGTPPAAAPQDPDTVRTDTLPRFGLQAITVEVVRATATTGGASAVELSLDSVPHLPAPTMEQVLRDMPLLVIRQNSRGQAQPAMRGAEERQIAVLVDGVPLTLGWDHRTDLSIIPLTAARDITLIRGLSSVLHGPNVLGGVVEVNVARGAGRMERPDPLSVSLALDHTGGRASSVTGGALLDDGQWVLRGGAGYQERPGVPLPDELRNDTDLRQALLGGGDADLRLNSDLERVDGFFAARYQRDDGRWFSLSTSAFTTERGVPPEAHVDEPRLWRYPDEERFVAAVSGGTGMRQTPWGEGDVEASVGMDLGKTRIDQYGSPDYDVVTGGEVGDDRTVTLRLLADHTLGSRTDLRTAFTWADVSHDEILDGTDFNEYRQRLWSLGAEVERRLDGFPGVAGLADSRVSLGFAADGADTPESGDKPPLERLWDWGARVGFTSVTAGGDVRVHGGFSRRTRFPALRELYSGALGRFEPNPDLRPEVLTGGELGFTWAPGEAQLQVVGFHQRLTDGIVRTSVQVDGESRFKRVNQNEVRSTGVELLGNARLGLLDLRGDLTLQDVKGLTADGREVELEYEPAVVGKVGVGGPLPVDVVGSADLRFTGEQLCQNPEVGGLQAFATDPNLDVTLRRSFRMGNGGALSRLEAALALENVGDAAVFDQCGLPQPGRTLRLQLRLR